MLPDVRDDDERQPTTADAAFRRLPPAAGLPADARMPALAAARCVPSSRADEYFTTPTTHAAFSQAFFLASASSRSNEDFAHAAYSKASSSRSDED